MIDTPPAQAKAFSFTPEPTATACVGNTVAVGSGLNELTACSSKPEFAHVLSTFPLVPDPVKTAAQNAYRDVERGLIR